MWTYNQGVVLSGAATLANLTNATAPLSVALAVAEAALTTFTSPALNPYGALEETSCGVGG